MGERLPIGVYRARGALQRLRANLATGRRIAPRRGEMWLAQATSDPALRAAVRQALAEQVARVRAITSEGPGQYEEPGQLIGLHDRDTSRIFPDVEPPGPEVDGLRDALAGYLGEQDAVDSLQDRSVLNRRALRVRLHTGTTIEIDLKEVPASAGLQ